MDGQLKIHDIANFSKLKIKAIIAIGQLLFRYLPLNRTGIDIGTIIETVDAPACDDCE